jgi:hypothetical protein
VNASGGHDQSSTVPQEKLSRTTPPWRRVAPYAVTLLIFTVIFSCIPAGKVGAALENVPIVKFLCVFLPFSAAYWLIDSACLTWVIRRFNASVRLREILPIRASMYLPALINTNLGQGGVAWYLHRKANIPFLEVLSSILFIAWMEIYQLFLFSTVGIALYHSGSPGQNRIVAILRVA